VSKKHIVFGAVLAGIVIWAGIVILGQTMEEKQSIARSQHDLMMLLIEKGDYEKIPDELTVILRLGLSGKYEKHVTDEIIILSTQLSSKNQFNICQQILDMGLETLKEKFSHARLYKEKGAVYKLAGDSDKALEMFKKSVELEDEVKNK
jgi:hypothetical protein